MNAFRTDMGRALGSKKVLLGSVGLGVAAVLGIWEELGALFPLEILSPGTVVEYTVMALTSGTALLVAPLVAALPFTGAFVEDKRSRFLRGFLPRCGRTVFIAARTWTVAVAGGIALAMGALLVLGTFVLVFGPWERIPEADGDAQQIVVDLSPFLMTLLLFFISGAFWSLVGSTLAAASMSQYLGITGPFVLYYVLVILAERYLTNVYPLNPKEWLAPSAEGGLGMAAPALLVGLLCVTLGVVHALVLEKRLRYV